VILEPGRQLLEDDGGVWPGIYSSIAALEGFDEGFADAVAFGASKRREAQDEVERGGEVGRLGNGVGNATVGEPLTGCGVRMASNRHSMQSSMRSRIISPEMPPLEMAAKVMISWSWVSITKAKRTTSLFQQGLSRPLRAQHRLEAGTMTMPSGVRVGHLPVWSCNSSEA
jgi:hypothetical protein